MHFPGAPPAIDGRSDAKWPETECVATSITCKCLASIGVECTAGVYVNNISTPTQSRSRDDLADCTLGTDCTDCNPRTNASAIVGTEITCNLNDGHETLVCIWAATSLLGSERFLAATPLAGTPLAGFTEYIIECGPLRGNDGSCADTSLCRNPVGKSTMDPHASCRGAACTRAVCNSTTAAGPRKGARKVLEIALEELFIKGKIGDAKVKYSFPYEDTAGEPNKKAADLDGVPREWVEVVDLAFVLLRLALFVWAICASWRRSGPKERFAYQAHRNQRFALAMLVLVVPRSSAMATMAPPDSSGNGEHRADSAQTPPLRPPPLNELSCANDVISGALDSSGAPLPCSYFSAQPSACDSNSLARTNCPVACGTCPPDPLGVVVSTEETRRALAAGKHAVQLHHRRAQQAQAGVVPSLTSTSSTSAGSSSLVTSPSFPRPPSPPSSASPAPRLRPLPPWPPLPPRLILPPMPFLYLPNSGPPPPPSSSPPPAPGAGGPPPPTPPHPTPPPPLFLPPPPHP
jgi:hypothetical protein